MNFDYYIFVDYSENFLGYLIVDVKDLNEIMPRISKFAHYKKLKHKSSYIKSIKKRIEKEKIMNYFLKVKIRNVRETPEIYADLAEFIKEKGNCLIFISIDDKQYSNFKRLVKNIDGRNISIVRESKLKKDSREDRLSLVIDTFLNIRRLKDEKR